MFLSWPIAKAGDQRRWETTIPDPDDSWRPIAISIMEVYTSRTHGSYIEETEMKVLWQYRDADPEFGYLQSRELEDHLSNVLRPYEVDVLHGGVDKGGFVEVRPKGVNKGVLSTLVMENLHQYATSGHRLDFCLTIGDDHCDEPMLSVVRQVGRRVTEARQEETMLTPMPSTVVPVDVSFLDECLSPDLQCFTVTVGKKPSAAANYLNDVEDVHELLASLNKMAARDQRYYSSYDLRDLGSYAANSAPTYMVPESFLKSNYNETITAGLTRSMSLSVIGTASTTTADPSPIKPFMEKTVSTNLGQYLEEIQGDEEEDPFFF